MFNECDSQFLDLCCFSMSKADVSDMAEEIETSNQKIYRNRQKYMEKGDGYFLP